MKMTFKQITKFIYNLLGLSSWMLANLFMGYTALVFIELGDRLSVFIGYCLMMAVTASFVALILFTLYLGNRFRLTINRGGA